MAFLNNENIHLFTETFPIFVAHHVFFFVVSQMRQVIYL